MHHLATIALTVAFGNLSMPHTVEALTGPMGDWDGESEVDIYSAVITARSCAEQMMDTGDLTLGSKCSPLESARTGFAIFDPVEGQAYLIDAASVHTFELEHGFGGSMDVYGEVKGTLDGLPVITPEDMTISPKPKPGAFKGCL
jgi:hypothetical protein